MGSRRYYLCAAAAGAILCAASPAVAASATYMVTIDRMKFAPVPAQLRKGDTIIWVNRDFLRHSATASDHSFDVDLPPNARAKTLLTKAGAIAFYCRYHPGMRGVLQIR